MRARGFVFASFDMDLLVTSMVGKQLLEVGMELFVEGVLPYSGALTGHRRTGLPGDSVPRAVLPRTPDSLQSERKISSYGIPWVARFNTTAKFEENAQQRGTWMILAVGLAASGGLATFTFLQSRGRARAETLLHDLTSSEARLRSSEAELRRSMEVRQRLNRDLHDNTIQRIYAAHIGLQRVGQWLREFAQSPANQESSGNGNRPGFQSHPEDCWSRREQASTSQCEIPQSLVTSAPARNETSQPIAQGLRNGRLIEKSQAEVAHSQKALGRINDELRQLLWQMEPVVLKGEPIETSLRNLIEGIQPYASARIVLEMNGPLDLLPEEAKHHVVSLVREAVTNAWRHGQATQVRVALEVTEAAAVLTVEDDGTGFDPATASRTGHGLGNMRQRLQELNGSFVASSQVGGPTRIRASWPLTTDAATL
jgi:signal transduction histidine kinase